VQATVIDRSGAALRDLRGDQAQVAMELLSFLAGEWDLRDFALALAEPSAELAQRLTAAARDRLLSESVEPVDATDWGYDSFSVRIAAELGPSWALMDVWERRLTICLWTSERIMQLLVFEDGGFAVQPAELWVSKWTWDGDSGTNGYELGLLLEGCVFERLCNSEQENLDLSPKASNACTSKRIIDAVATTVGKSILPQLYLMGLPCDGSLSEEEFAVLAQVDEGFAWMTELIVAPPERLVDRVRAELAKRATGPIDPNLTSAIGLARIRSSPGAEPDWPTILRILRRDVGSYGE
jgi:hypothetical protein